MKSMSLPDMAKIAKEMAVTHMVWKVPLKRLLKISFLKTESWHSLLAMLFINRPPLLPPNLPILTEPCK